MKLIDKDALVAEINRQIELLNPYLGACAGQIVAEANSKNAAYNRVKDIINVLEVKEVDLENYNKVKKALSLSFMHFLDANRQEGKMCLSNGECFDIDKAFDEMDFAKLFRYMEKYLKAQKG